MPLILYKSDASPPARAVLMLVDILGLKLDLRDVNPVLREQDTPEMTDKNPMRTVPTLEDDGFCLADSHAIMIYLIEKYGKAEHAFLYPADERKRATVLQRLFFDCGILFPRLRAIMAPTFGGRLTELSRSMIRNVEDAYRTLEAYLSKTKYLADDVMTVADISAMTTVSSIDGLHPIDGKRFPKTKEWLKKMEQETYSKKINEPGNEQFLAGMKAFMENNKLKNKAKL